MYFKIFFYYDQPFKSYFPYRDKQKYLILHVILEKVDVFACHIGQGNILISAGVCELNIAQGTSMICPSV